MPLSPKPLHVARASATTACDGRHHSAPPRPLCSSFPHRPQVALRLRSVPPPRTEHAITRSPPTLRIRPPPRIVPILPVQRPPYQGEGDGVDVGPPQIALVQRGEAPLEPGQIRRRPSHGTFSIVNPMPTLLLESVRISSSFPQARNDPSRKWLSLTKILAP